MQLITEEIQKSMAGSSWIRKMFEKGLELKTKYGADAVCDFSLGNPDVPPPTAAKGALEEIAAHAVEPLGLGYCPNAGIPAVREAMADYINRQQGLDSSAAHCEAGHVVMTVGAAGALVAFFRAVIEPGDEVVCPAPYFVEYASYCGHFGGVLKTIPSKSDDFSPDIEGLAAAITPRTRAILVNSPNNPTGAIYTAETMRRIAKLVDDVNAARGDAARPLYLLSDEPYRAFAYDGVVVAPVLPLTKWSLVLGSFSKTLSLAGERVGYIALNPAMPDVATLAAAVTLTNRTLGYVNAPVIGQRLAARLLDATVDLGVYDRRRKLMAEVLTAAGVEFAMPKGAFYFFPKAPGGDDLAFTDALLDERILVVPGRGFGGPGHVRLSCSVDERIIARAADGFRRAVAKCKALLAVTICTVAAFAAQAERPVTAQALETLKHSLIHRGDGKGRPDNTMEALLYTWAKGYTPESDIRYTKDGKIVAFHDNSLKKRKISEWLWAELREEDVGSYRGAQYATCRAPLWETIFTAMEENPVRKMHIDWKDVPPEKVAEMVKAHGLQKQCWFITREYDLIKRYKKALPDGQTLHWMNLGNWNRIDFGKPGETDKAEAAMMALFEKAAAENFKDIDNVQLHCQLRYGADGKPTFCPKPETMMKCVARLHAAGVEASMCVWHEEANRPETYLALWEFGFDSFGTDYPEALYKAVDVLKTRMK